VEPRRKRRDDPAMISIASHRFGTPVVREIRLPPADTAGDGTW
jgi:hypothetical protein